MTRIVAGSVGGRRLSTPPGRLTRPTSERAREALFGSLGSVLDLAGARVLDLYAGSGAVGLEALSRGAGRAVLIEADPRAAATIRGNADTLGFGDRAVVVRERVERALSAAGDPYDLIFADPPYRLPADAVDEVIDRLVRSGWIAPGGVVVVERPHRDRGPAWPVSLTPLRSRRYGEGTLWYGRRP